MRAGWPTHGASDQGSIDNPCGPRAPQGRGRDLLQAARCDAQEIVLCGMRPESLSGSGR
jgi:hypothetical protein